MNKILVIIFIMCSSIVACTTTSSYIPIKNLPQKSNHCSLQIYMPGQQINRKFELVGLFSVQEMGLSVNCDWEETLKKNKDKACEVGADAIQFISIEAPSFESTCYRTKANFIVFTE